MKTILFVCTANICRSPMAAGLMRQRIADLGLSDQVQVLSAGVWAGENFGASDGAVSVMRRRRIDLGDHRSQPVTTELLDQADIILVMEEAHRRSLFYFSPRHLGKTFLLTEMAGQHDDVADPYGGPIEKYEQTAALLEGLVDQGMPAILERLGIRPHTAPSSAPLPHRNSEEPADRQPELPAPHAGERVHRAPPAMADSHAPDTSAA